ncbi:MAG: amino acid adenylation domain-containing protein, partial [Cyanobacteria bacterium J06639_14]
MIALLAILKVGGTYIPLDPSYPAERLRFILTDAAVSLLIATNADQAMLGNAHPTVRVLDLGDVGGRSVDRTMTSEETRCIASLQGDGDGRSDGDRIPIYPSTHPPIHPSTLAYLIYTSGSTGSPKGVPICHHSLTNLLTSMAQVPGMTAQDTLLAVTTPAFDIAALELFLPLTVGGTLVVASQEAVRDPQQLAAQLTQHDVTLMQATPATWRLLLESGWQGKANLKLLCGGEALDIALAQTLLNCGTELWNLYGPTETTIWSAALRIEASTLQDGIVPIGKPIANTQFQVLDSQQRPVPVGVPGELHIGGLGLSPGYWQREDLTGDRFIKGQVLSEEPGFSWPSSSPQLPDKRNPVPELNQQRRTKNEERLYKTGDLVRYLEDGNLQYLGRLDYQVKLRGFRIELGEIETVLAQHPDVAQAVVVLREGESAGQQLVGYVVSQESGVRSQELGARSQESGARS